MELVSLEKKYQGKFLTYYVAEFIIKDGTIYPYEFVSRDSNLTKETFGSFIPAGVGIFTLTVDRQKVLLQKEFRLSTNNYVYTCPAGLIDPNEDFKVAAKREIKEETGCDVVEVLDILPNCFSAIGLSDEAMALMVCTVEGEPKEAMNPDEEIIASYYTKDEVRKLMDEKVPFSVWTDIFLHQWLKEE